MENKTIRRTLYKVLRKTGVPRKEIELDATFDEDLNFDQVDWALFLYYLEEGFKINVEDEEISRMHQVKDTLNLMESMTY
ncbi:acyl carrier protein [uncultured Sunxiuqinia sp.]|jgi:acyl carrier protein|uniref:acyl carrier protein n=1 Tax=uncultured Sunxiuqinia sp. TaxID=1573825 RepID=UPI0019913021|nr:acyl carrier protein [Sunxiuqinia sp.]|tara:strand:+ start:18982 stop:19221 length:240 start_codon:yes stop_codon:yes gene_type:complete